jgi:hypothetical protein
MDDMKLPFFIGSIEDFESCGIDTSTLRKSLDNAQVIIHLHNLTIEQFNAIRVKTNVAALSYQQVQDLMQTSEWKSIES